MFDVIWTDPDRELVGERRARKEVEKERKVLEKPSSLRPSSSTKSTSSHSDKSFSFRGAKNLRKVFIGTSPSRSPTPSSLASPTLDSRPRRTSILGVPSVLSDASGESRQSTMTAHVPATLPEFETGETSPGSSSRDSIFSKWTEPSIVTCNSPSAASFADSHAKSTSLIQTLGPSSFVTKSTEVIVTPRSPGVDIAEMISEVSISSEGHKDTLPTPPRSPIETTSPYRDTVVHLLSVKPKPNVPTSPAPWASSTFKPNNPDAWRPPEDWDCTPASEVGRTVSVTDIRSSRASEISNEKQKHLRVMHEELVRMASQPPAEIVSRMKEIAAKAQSQQSVSELHREEKKWMLSSLRNLDPIVEPNPSNPPVQKPAASAYKVLALYESDATASYMAALHCDTEVYHLSQTPLSPELFPNVHPLQVPAVSPSSFPVAPQLFGAVYSLSLPGICPSQDIPATLRNIHRSLSRGGTLHLTLIDPLPHPPTLGPKLRAWMEENLLLSLERQFRCISPSKLFPVWMADAHLRGEGSAITTARFAAVPQQIRGDDSTPEEDPARAEKKAKSELRALVGRMLWVEVWGQFIEGTTWWWQNDDIVNECMEMGTFWEYSLIEGVREEIV